ncbi:MAG: dUTP diphosphatase [Clostridia bacterium]
MEKNQVPVKIKKLHADAIVPVYAKAMDAGFDLVAIEDVLIQPGETAKIPTGLAFAIPAGYELQIRPRSGISAKTKLRLSNAPGTIDSGYRGEVCVLVDNIRPISGKLGTACYNVGEQIMEIPHQTDANAYLIRKGDRIAQGVLSEVPQAVFEVVDELDETERGSGGFGSSGTRAN